MVNKRIYFLDGIRGWGAIMVLLSHIIMCYLVYTTPTYDTFVLKFITDGHLAVLIFFVLSGFVLTVIQENKEKNIIGQIISRYIRLMIPILATTLIIYFLFSNGLFFHQAVVDIAPLNEEWLGKHYEFEPHFFDAIKYSLYDVFFNFEHINNFNRVLWTMQFEFKGSILIFILPWMFRKNSTLHWVFVSLVTFFLWFYNPLYSAFLFGYFLAKLNNLIQNFVSKNSFIVSEFYGLFLFITVVLLSTFYRPNDDKYTALMAMALILSVQISSYLNSFFSNRISRFLGKISFSVYMIQMGVIFSLSSYMFLHKDTLSTHNFISSNIIILATVVFTLILGYLLTPIDKLSIILSRKISGKISNINFFKKQFYS